MACYKRAYAAGEFPKRPKSPADRFYGHVNKGGPVPPRAPHLGECWLWEANKLPSGYGIVGRGGRHGGTTLAHRFIYELEVGQIPEKATIDHLCFVPSCVRVDHLEAVSQKVNNQRSPLIQFKVNAAKTHCKYGHEFSPQNTYLQKRDGGARSQRVCRECVRISQREYYLRKKAKHGTV